MRKIVELNHAGKGIDLIPLSTLANLETFGGISYPSELLSYANVEKFDAPVKLIVDL
ncbi:hypothetical protein V7111_24730 [Neobacillus niacini]|uniref:hypothetical protein n=1 Tax=Neobacillus niacini TaxID=86668 RepID=UPI0030035B9B